MFKVHVREPSYLELPDASSLACNNEMTPMLQVMDIALLALVLKHAAVAITLMLAGIGATFLASCWKKSLHPVSETERPRTDDITTDLSIISTGLNTFKQIIGHSSVASYERSDMSIQKGEHCHSLTSKVDLHTCSCAEQCF